MASIRALLLDELGYEPEALSRHSPPDAAGQAKALPSVTEAADRVAAREITAAQHEGARVAVGRTASGRLFVLPDRCPHDGGPISDGFVEGEAIVCARHGWELDPCSGACRRATLAS